MKNKEFVSGLRGFEYGKYYRRSWKLIKTIEGR